MTKYLLKVIFGSESFYLFCTFKGWSLNSQQVGTLQYVQIRSQFIQSFPVLGLPYCFFNSPWGILGLGLFCLVVWVFLFYVTKMPMRDCLEQFLSVPCSSLLVCGFAPTITMKLKLLDVSAPRVHWLVAGTRE